MKWASAYPILAVTVPGADDDPGLFNHLQNGPSMNIASHVGIIWTHDPAADKQETEANDKHPWCHPPPKPLLHQVQWYIATTPA